MTIMPIQILPGTQKGPSSPMELAQRREDALMITKTATSLAGEAPSSQDVTAEKIARGADPDAVLGGLAGMSSKEPSEAPTAQGKLAELISRGADPEAIFGLVSGSKAPEGEAPMSKLQAAVEAHRAATQGYASASQAFRDAITQNTEAALDVRIGETSRVS